MPEIILMMAIALLASEIYMSLTWLLSRKIKNAGIVDVAWASGFTLLAFFYTFYSGHFSNAPFLTLAAMYIVWSLRLSWHLLTRFLRWYPNEDARYSELKEKLGNRAGWFMYIIFLWQGAILFFLCTPLAVAASNPGNNFLLLQLLALFVWAVGLIGETIADAQLVQFTKDTANKGKTCRVGLWSVSRHPNYFFEWLGSVSFSLYVLELPYGIWTLACPLVLMHLLFNVTGIRPAEEHSLKTRTDYAEYIQSTSAFFPWWRKTKS